VRAALAFVARNLKFEETPGTSRKFFEKKLLRITSRAGHQAGQDVWKKIISSLERVQYYPGKNDILSDAINCGDSVTPADERNFGESRSWRKQENQI
jgi:hypothetical protein